MAYEPMVKVHKCKLCGVKMKKDPDTVALHRKLKHPEAKAVINLRGLPKA